MEISTVLFYVFAAILVASSLMVIVSRNAVYSALFLVLAFCTAGAIWLLMQAEFLAIALVLIYVGAVMVLFLFVVMMLDVNIERARQGFWRYLPVGLVVAGVLLFEMVIVLREPYFQLERLPAPVGSDVSNTKALAMELFSNYAYPFEIASIILFVAMVAAVALTFRRREGLKYTDPAAQIAVKAKDRMRLVSMPAEERQ